MNAELVLKDRQGDTREEVLDEARALAAAWFGLADPRCVQLDEEPAFIATNARFTVTITATIAHSWHRPHHFQRECYRCHVKEWD